ncbi:MAG: FG-GAP-like repeat-containing protein [Pseudomonadota bacterium]
MNSLAICAVAVLFSFAVSNAATVPANTETSPPPPQTAGTTGTTGTTGVDPDTFPKDMPNKLPEVAQNVSGSSGTFSYSVPISVPSYYGIQPSLALSYNSAGGNGPVGVGWSLSGYSTIERKGPWHTLPQYDATDVYYLDGEVLSRCKDQLAKSPTCKNVDAFGGNSEKHYSPLNESFQRVEKNEDYGTWIVWRKDGTKAVYDSICRAKNGQTFRWGLERVEHPNGAIVVYQADCTEGLQKVGYDGIPLEWVSQPTLALPSAKIKVSFDYPSDYPSRPDPVYFTDATQVLTTAGRLSTVTVKINGITASTYNLTYDPSKVSGRSLLKTVTQVGSDGSTLPPTTFEWYENDQTGAMSLTDVTGGSPGTWAGEYRQVATGDFNGDGRSDLLLKSSIFDKTYLALGTPDGGFTLRDITEHPCPTCKDGRMNRCKWMAGVTGQILTGDFNGDRRTDILLQPARSTIDGANVIPNCDGGPDFRPWLLLSSGDNTIFLPAEDASRSIWNLGDQFSYGDAWICNQQPLNTSFWCTNNVENWDAFNWEIVTGDFNGDRRTDLLVRNRSFGRLSGSGTVFLALNGPSNTFRDKLFQVGSGSGLLGSSLNGAWRTHAWIPGDFNADGVTDILLKEESDWDNLSASDSYLILIGVRGIGSKVLENPLGSSNPKYHNLIPGDFNGDGLLDLLVQKTPSTLSSGNYLLTNQGGGVFEGSNNNLPSVDLLSSNDIYWHERAIQVGDVNGDGKAEAILQAPNTDVGDPWIHIVRVIGSNEIQTLSGDSFSSNYKRISAGDFLGRGTTDLVGRAVHSSTQSKTYLLQSNASKDVIHLITTPLGGKTEISYTPSTAWPGNQVGLPVVQTVQTVSVFDGRNCVYGGACNYPSVTEYSYEGGKYDFVRKKSLGFQKVIVRLPQTQQELASTEELPTYVETEYHQGFHSAGRPIATTYWQGYPRGTPLQETVYGYCELWGIYTWTTGGGGGFIQSATAPGSGGGSGGGGGTTVRYSDPYWSLFVPSDVRQWYFGKEASASSNPLTMTRTETIYDVCSNAGNFGNVLRQKDYGLWSQSLDNPADDQTTVYTYETKNNATTYRVDRAIKTEVMKGTTTLVGPISKAENAYFQEGEGDGKVGNIKSQKTYVYERNGDAWSVVKDTTRSFDYDVYGNLTKEVNELGFPTFHAYDKTYHLFLTCSVQNAYNLLSSLTPAMDPGDCDLYRPNPLSNFTKEGATNRGNIVATTIYKDLCGAPSSVKDPNGQETKTDYDGFCRETKVTDPFGEYQQTSYLNFGNPAIQHTKTTGPIPQAAPGKTNGRTWTKAYMDGFGRNYWTESGSSASGSKIIVSQTAYDSRGLARAKSRPYESGESPVYSFVLYDTLNRPIKLLYPDNANVRADYEYQPQSSSSLAFLKTTYWDEESHETSDIYDARGKIVTHTENLGTTALPVKYEFDSLGNLKKITDPTEKNVTETWFDSRGLLTRELDPDRGETNFTYDNRGQLTRAEDNQNQKVEYGYDPIGRKVEKKLFPDKNSSSYTGSRWAYDQQRSGYFNLGRLTQMVDPHGEELYNYDALGRLRTTNRKVGLTWYAFSQAYDKSGRVVLKDYYLGNIPFNYSYGYDPLGRMNYVSGAMESADYYADGQIKEQVYASPNPNKTTYEYDNARGWLTKICTQKKTEAKNTCSVQNLDYGRPNRNKEGMLTVRGPWRFTYDSLHRLTDAVYNGNTGDPNTEYYKYDSIGNLTEKKVGSLTRTMTYPSSGSAIPHAVKTVSGVSGTYGYDLNGNMTTHWDVAKNSPATIRYDVENYPVEHCKALLGTGEACPAGLGTTFTYDGNSQRLKLSTPTKTTLYLEGGLVEIPQ